MSTEAQEPAHTPSAVSTTGDTLVGSLLATNDTPSADDDVLRYDFKRIEGTWPKVWRDLKPFISSNANDPRPKKYILDMFPYPSGDLHMGHAEAYSIGDSIARYWLQRGYNVMHPMGWDAFGLPAENAAIKRGANPATWTYENIAQQRSSMERYACMFDWDRTFNTCDPEYYRWNQWLFIQMFKNGLAYRRPSQVNWCPTCQTVLANEQVVGGLCERCDSAVTKKKLTQWFFKVTDYADQLVDDLEQLHGTWPEKVITMQRNWIGRSRGAEVTFKVEGVNGDDERDVTVFTTRPDTLYGATFMVIAVDSDLAAELAAESSPEVQSAFSEYLEKTKAATDIERLATDRPKTGVFLHRYAVNPVNGERIPVWASDYVLADYGHGAIMAVPAHDQRDLDFARACDLPIRVVLDVKDDTGASLEDPAVSGQAVVGDGVLINSGSLNGLTKDAAIERMTAELADKGMGGSATNYRLRDWLISRQRYWGTPIPIVHCEACGEVAVPEDQLPVELPDAATVDLRPQGVSPLAGADEWATTTCPTCTGPARRDPDTMDTFVDSSWYFLRFCSPGRTDVPFDPADVREWCPVEQYVGGVTHAILHLLYARFVTKALRDMGMLDFSEPFTRLLNQGMVTMGGSAMSKSRGNLVQLSQQLDEFGVDAVRLTMAFAGPPEDDIDWADVSAQGSGRFLSRAWRLAVDVASEPTVNKAGGDKALRSLTHKTVHECTGLMEQFKLNVVVARLMELVNATRKAIDSGPGPKDPAVREAVEALAVMLSMFAPYTAEDMWAILGHQPCVAVAGWPAVDESLLRVESVTCVVQIAGKVRAKLDVSPDISENDLEALAVANPHVLAAMDGREIRKIIVRAPKVVNIVPA